MFNVFKFTHQRYFDLRQEFLEAFYYEQEALTFARQQAQKKGGYYFVERQDGQAIAYIGDCFIFS